jgi:hypothetical protein
MERMKDYSCRNHELSVKSMLDFGNWIEKLDKEVTNNYATLWSKIETDVKNKAYVLQGQIEQIMETKNDFEDRIMKMLIKMDDKVNNTLSKNETLKFM